MADGAKTGLDAPMRVARALREISAHDRCVGVRVASSQWPILVELGIDTGLPSRWRAKGESPSGVRETETVSIVFPESFPSSAPRIYLRADFDRSHPHIQPSALGPPEPCLLHGSVSELLRSRGMTAIVDQLAQWLERAAHARLIDPDQGWEPVRRDRLDDYVIADAGRLRRWVTRESDCKLLTARFVGAQEDGAWDYVTVIDGAETKVDAKLPHRWSRPGNMDCLALVTWSGKRPSGDEFVANQYLPEAVADVRGLLERAKRLGCGDGLAAKLGLLELRLRGLRLPAPVPVAIVLIVRRPCDLIGEGSPLEICPYVIELNGGDDLGQGSTKPVRIAAHLETVTPALLRRAAGDGPSSDSFRWTLIGCGSVGSKLAVHLARSGRAPSLLIDAAPMRPHNLARHALLPASELESALMPPKSTGVLQAIAALGQSAAAKRLDVVPALARGDSSEIALEGTQLIVNATGSLAVRETLAKPDLHRPRVVESCLLGAGRIAFLSVEGPGANPSTLDLAAEAYAAIAADEEMRAVAFGSPPVELAIGAGCSSLTFPMSDARLSALTAPMAEHVGRLLADPGPEGQLLVGITAEDGLGQRWLRRRVPPTVEIRGQGVSVRVSAAVDQRIAREVASKPGRETGGVILGRWCDVTESFQVVDLLPAPPDSRFSPSEFVLGVEGLREALEDVFRNTGGSLYALGTWHNHLVASPPSGLDASTAALLALRQLYPALLLIHVPGGYRILVAETTFELKGL